MQQLDLFDSDVKLFDSSGYTKVCKYCEKDLPIEYFQLRYKGYEPDSTQGRNHICNSCYREAADRLKQIKKTAPEKPADNKCDCCGSIIETFYLDHDHKTGLFRGWVCRSCNVGLGFLGDDIAGVTKALEYLRVNNEKS